MAQRNAKKNPRLTTNGYLNFLSEFRRNPKNARLSATETVRKGASMWRQFTDAEKQIYKKEAKLYGSPSVSRSTPKKKPIPKEQGKKKLFAAEAPTVWTSLTAVQMANLKGKKLKQMPPPWVVKKDDPKGRRLGDKRCDDDGFVDFVRLYAGRSCNLSKSRILKRATRVWKVLSDDKKERCRRMALQKFAMN